MNFLAGKKTYIAAAILFILGGLKALGVIDDVAFQELVTIFGAFGLAALRKGMEE